MSALALGPLEPALEPASVVSVSPETRVRWLAYRRALEAGYPDAPTYDWALHPATRVPLAAILLAYPELRGELS